MNHRSTSLPVILWSRLLLLLAAFVWIFCPTGVAWPVPTAEERALDASLASLTRELDFSEMINPTPESAARERKAFFAALAKGRTIEPQFDYGVVDQATRAQIRRLSALPQAKGPYGALLEGVRRENLRKAELLEARGRDAFTRVSAGIYPFPSQETLAEARRLVAGKVPPDPTLDVDVETMRQHLEKALMDGGLQGWRVRISDRLSARASVSPGARVVKIQKGARFSAEDVTRLVHHEIGVHARRAENGHRLPMAIFARGLADYLRTEEGMAAVNEERHGIRSGLRLFALRALAVDAARKRPFSGVYRLLIGWGADQEMAFAISQRVKRGLTDTGRPGAYTKDSVYLEGYLAVKRFLEKQGHWDDLLRFGKIGLGDLAVVNALSRMP